eukprot:CAMPEP_0202884396 /NCGR_PEP_ID=MMETSP1391-20130828/40903_1 /ASSEMBLY_ACC=CAM_ASM_000867 /TAXON_ID=1034604 /ORGANISM="Chlamydomonas leiostraca, Strain SAG 11-49" /LENGTH=44 /DNA_ID= /DNA_START= /DNA_END= /DNA_ORIENTATION=
MHAGAWHVQLAHAGMSAWHCMAATPAVGAAHNPDDIPAALHASL